MHLPIVYSDAPYLTDLGSSRDAVVIDVVVSSAVESDRPT
jgi:hypothetical protein